MRLGRGCRPSLIAPAILIPTLDLGPSDFSTFVNESAAGGEGDDFEFVIGLDDGGCEVAWEDGLLVEFRDDGFSAEVEAFEKMVEGGFFLDGMGLSVECDLHFVGER